MRVVVDMMTLNADSEEVQVNDAQSECIGQKCKFVEIGVVVDLEPIATIMSQRTQKGMSNLKLAAQRQDRRDSVEPVREDLDESNAIVAFNGCELSAFGRRSLSALGLIAIYPDRQEAMQLLQCLNSQGGAVDQVRRAQLGRRRRRLW